MITGFRSNKLIFFLEREKVDERECGVNHILKFRRDEDDEDKNRINVKNADGGRRLS